MKVSVAMASYNGEKYIREQIESILNQTHSIDELIISDDGSADATISIAESFHDQRIKILADNPNHGYCGNFEWAIKHTTGDIIFLADQDDIWTADKVEQCVSVFNNNPDVWLLISNGILIDKYGNKLVGSFNHYITGGTGFVDRDKYLSLTVWNALANGMCMCFIKSFKQDILPFPDSTMCHDRWIAFCGVCKNTCYFLDEALVKYRIHDTNTSIRGNIGIKKRIHRALNIAYNIPFDLLHMANAMMSKLDDNDLSSTKAYEAAQSLADFYKKQVIALNAFPLVGAYHLISMYLTDPLYKREGLKNCLAQLFLLFTRKRNERSLSL